MDAAFYLLSGSAAAVGALFAPLFTSQRNYSTQQNGQQMRKLIDTLPDDMCLSCGPHAYHRHKWTPTCMMSRAPLYCAVVSARTSENDPNRQTFDVLVYRPACFRWDAFDLRTKADDGDRENATPTVRVALTEMLHIVITHASLEHPCWSTVKRSLLPPGISVDDPELKTASDLARAIHHDRLPNGSGVFLVRGPKMTGKSSAAKLIAAMWLKPNALVCEEFSPTTPGHLLSAIEEIRDQHDRTAELLVIIEEATWLEHIAHMKNDDSRPMLHPKLLTQVTCKDDWNSWPERAVKIPNCIIVITANFDDKVRADFEHLQNGSMLRKNRITAEYVTLACGGFRRHGEKNVEHEPPAIEDMMWRSSSSSSSASDDLMQPLLL
jgi:hypothetical protein